MSYLVLARKYRPTTFSEVVGQEHVTRTLGNAFAAGRVHHAFLFCGPRGCGKTTLARIVGKALNCRGPDEGQHGATAEPCNACSACTSISSGSAVDYQEMDGASNRGIDAIRELTEAVRYQPAVLRKKVYVIDEVHMLTTEAFNALLKTLEEPPPHVTFVLATTEPHKLPNTILSRCQRYDFKLVPASRLAQHLTNIFAKEQLPIESGAVSLLVRESGGSVRDALSLCDQLISYVGAATITEQHVAEVLGVADRTLTRTLVRALAAGEAGTALGAVESAIERGVDEVQLARAIVRYLRDLSVLQVAPDRPELVDAAEDERAELLEEARGLERSRITQMFERMLRCCDELGKTLQPRLVLDCALIDVATVEPLVPLGDLIERLGELEARLTGKGARASGAGSGSPPARPRAPAGPPPRTSASPPGRSSSGPAASSAPASSAIGASGPTSSAAGTSAPASSAAGTSVPASSAAGTSAPPHSTVASSGPAHGAASSSGPAHSTASSSPQRAEPPVAPPPRSAPVERAPAPTPVLAQPSGPVPRASAVASGSGPTPPKRGDGDLPLPTMGVPASPDDAMRAWGAVLGQLEARKKFSLLGPFQHARVMRWTAEEVELGFPVDFHSMGEMAADAGTLGDLRALIKDLVPDMKSVKLSVRLLDAAESERAGARSILETSRDRSNAERTKREHEAREHPITKHVLQTFGAQIKEIKTDV
ncbi:MAG: DNA polymerase III subunit gamma/tau [Kofleriaceae bacterium]